MREIKFRAWDKHRKEYLSAGQVLLAILPGSRPEHNPIYLDVLKCADVYRERFDLEQFTGVYDKNGKEIYEGDIIQTYFSFDPGDAGYGVSQKPFVVDWNQEHASFRAKKPEAEAGSLHLLDIISFFSMQSRLYEVIGNIHENPELLEAKP